MANHKMTRAVMARYLTPQRINLRQSNLIYKLRGITTGQTTSLGSPRPVKLLGSQYLQTVCTPVADDDLGLEKSCLVATLEDFRSKNGFGRGIAAPQIGITRRFIALNLGDGPQILSDPEIIHRSEETMTLWDDCMSLPWVLCRVRRHRNISVKFINENGHSEVWENLDESVSELLQHELDHLDGVLIIDRMLSACSGVVETSADTQFPMMISRDEYNMARSRFDAMVDFAIIPTIKE